MQNPHAVFDGSKQLFLLYLMEVIQLFMKEKKGVQIEELKDEGKENL